MQQFKIVLLGDASVGKSTMISRYIDGDYDEYYTSTIGIDFKRKTIFRGDKKIYLQIWDTAGQERFQSLSTIHYRNSHCFILLFDLTDVISFKKLEDYLEMIQLHMTFEPLIIIFGTKKDIINRRVVKIEDISAFREQNKFEYFEISSKTNENIDIAFDHIVDILIEKFECVDNSEKITQRKIDFAHNAPGYNYNSGCC
jgi:small GTP-binding protein